MWDVGTLNETTYFKTREIAQIALYKIFKTINFYNLIII